MNLLYVFAHFFKMGLRNPEFVLLRRRFSSRGCDAQLFVQLVYQLLRIYAPHSHNAYVISRIALVHIAAYIFARKRSHVVRRSQNCLGDRSSVEKQLCDPFLRYVVGLIVAHCDFFQNHALLFFHL